MPFLVGWHLLRSKNCVLVFEVEKKRLQKSENRLWVLPSMFQSSFRIETGSYLFVWLHRLSRDYTFARAHKRVYVGRCLLERSLSYQWCKGTMLCAFIFSFYLRCCLVIIYNEVFVPILVLQRKLPRKILSTEMYFYSFIV